jgi:hypothetical protein
MTVAGREEERLPAQVLVDQFCARAQPGGLAISCDRTGGGGRSGGSNRYGRA